MVKCERPSAPLSEVTVNETPSRDDWLYLPLSTLKVSDDRRVTVANALGLIEAGDIPANLEDINSIQFDITPTGTAPEEGKLIWNADDGTLNIGMPGGNVNLQIGQELLVRCKNSSGADMTNGQLVYISGASGDRPQITLAKADAEATSAGTLGMLTEDIADGQNGYVTTFGNVRDIATDPGTYTAGDMVWLSAATAGAYTNVKPASPNHTTIIGEVVRAHATEGIIFVRIDNGLEFYELHDVSDSLATPTAGELTAWNAVTTLWEQAANLAFNFATEQLSATSFAGDGSGLTGIEIEDTNLAVAAPITLGGAGSNIVGFDFSTNNTWTGTFKHQNASDSTTAFQILDADGGSPLFNGDTTNERIGVCTDSPLKPLHVQESAISSGTIGLFNSVASGVNGGAGTVHYSDDGAATASGDRLGFVLFGGAKDTVHTLYHGAGIVGYAEETWATGKSGANLQFQTASLGQLSRTTKLHVGADGDIVITNFTSTTVGLLVKGAAGQSANPSEWQDVSGNVLISMDAAGGAVFNENGNDADFRVEGNTEDKLFITDAGADEVRMGDGDTNYVVIGKTGIQQFRGTSRIGWTKITANGVTKTRGTSADTVSDLQTANDGNLYTLDEQTAGVGMDFVVDFTGVTAINWIRILGYYVGSATHGQSIQLEITPFDGSAWHTFNGMDHHAGANGPEAYDFFIPDDAAYINGGVVKVRFYHVANGVAGHDLILDEVALYQ